MMSQPSMLYLLDHSRAKLGQIRSETCPGPYEMWRGRCSSFLVGLKKELTMPGVTDQDLPLSMLWDLEAILKLATPGDSLYSYLIELPGFRINEKPISIYAIKQHLDMMAVLWPLMSEVIEDFYSAPA